MVGGSVVVLGRGVNASDCDVNGLLLVEKLFAVDKVDMDEKISSSAFFCDVVLSSVD